MMNTLHHYHQRLAVHLPVELRYARSPVQPLPKLSQRSHLNCNWVIAKNRPFAVSSELAVPDVYRVAGRSAETQSQYPCLQIFLQCYLYC